MTVPMILFQPPGACRKFTRSGSLYPPLGLCQLAAMTTPDRVRVVDADGEGWSDDEAFARVVSHSPVVVGMTATSYTLELVESWAARFSGVGIRVIAGGPHATLAPHNLLDQCPSVEVAVCGEAEPVVEHLVERAVSAESFAGILGVVTRHSPPVDASPVRVPDLGSLPFPTFAGLPVSAYGCPDAKRRPLVTMATTRGCPHRCGFCSSPALLGKKVRCVPVEQVLRELERLVSERGVREVSFVDDVFTIVPKRTLELCRGMVDRGLDLTWFCNARADQVSEELAAAMAAAGCHQVYLGFESGSQAILDLIQKGATVEQLERGATHLARHGVARSVGFVIGLPGETDETVDASIALAGRVRPERLQFTRFTPLVGSPLASVPPSGHFHSRGGDAVGQWIDRCYAASQGEPWGQESW